MPDRFVSYFLNIGFTIVGSHFFYCFLLSSAYRSNAQSFKGHGGEVVDRVVLCSDKDKNMCIKFLIRHTRRPEVKLFMVCHELVLLVRNSVFISSLNLLH